jgi:putative membrane protein
VCIQKFGGSALVLVSLAPNPTDDLDFSTGYAIRETVRGCGYDDSLVIDSHNCLSPGSGLVHFGSKISNDIIETAKISAQVAHENSSRGLKVGIAESRGLRVSSLGPMGIQVLVLEVQGQKTAYILFDGNNLVPGFREEIMADVRGLVDEAEVLTSDNHIANITYGSYNPVGLHSRRELAGLTKNLVAKAVGDLEDAEVAMKTGIIEDFKVFGHDSATRLASLITSTVSTLRISAFLSLVVAYSLSVIAILLIV